MASPTSESDVFFEVIVGVDSAGDFALLIGVTVKVSGCSSSEASQPRLFAKNLEKHDGMVSSPASGFGRVSATTSGLGRVSATTVRSLSEKKRRYKALLSRFLP